MAAWTGTIEQGCGEWLTRQRGLLLPWLAVFMGAGVGLYFSLRFEPGVRATAVIGGVLLMTCVMAGIFRARSNAGAVAFHGLLLLCLAGVGFGLAQLRAHEVASPMLDHAIKRTGVIGVVRSVELLEPGKGYRLILGHVEVQDLAPGATPTLVRLRVRGTPAVRVGQRIYLEAGLNPPAAPVAPGAFDFQFYAWFKRIGAFGFAYTQPEILDPSPQKGYWAEKARAAIGAQVGRSLSGREAAMSVAMMNGEVSGVSADDWQAMRNAGLAHILAISGSHVTVLAGFVFFAVRFMLALWPHAALHWPIKKFAAVAAAVAATVYVYMVGPLIPIMRAYLMTDLILLAVIVDRLPISLNLLAFSAMLVMAWMPEQALGPSFQMSYAAVAALILVYEYTKGWWRAAYADAGWARKAALYLVGVLVTSLAATLATSPLSLYHFQQVTIYGLVANMLTAPILSFIVMPGVLMVFLAMPFGLEAWPVRFLGLGDRLILDVAHWVGGWRHAAIFLPPIPAGAVLLLFGGAAVALCLRGRVRWAGGAMIALAALLAVLHRQPDILVSSSGKLAAVRLADGNLTLSSRVADRFVAGQWMQLAGRPDGVAEKWPDDGAGGLYLQLQLPPAARRAGRRLPTR